MKNLFTTTILSLLVLFTACKKDASLQRSTGETTTTTVTDKKSETYKRIIALGYKDHQIVQKGEYYIVNNSLIFEINPEKPADADEKLYRTEALIKYGFQSNIKIMIGSGIPSAWVPAINAAVNDWNAITNSRLHFNIVTTGSYDILIRHDYENIMQDGYTLCTGCNNDPGISLGSVPQYGRAGSLIIINENVDMTGGTPLDLATMRYHIAHNLGHSVGLLDLGDTYTNLPIYSGASQNSNSVMVKNINSENVISSVDKTDIVYLYGVGKRINIKTSGGNWLQAANGGGGSLVASSTNPWGWETFHLIESPLYGAPYYVLQGRNGKYVQAANGGGSTINVNSSNPWEWESFQLIPSGTPNKYFLKTKATSQYVQALNGGGSSVNAASANPWEWETFEFSDAEF